MEVKELKLTPSCKLTYTNYENIFVKDVCLEYVEHSSDHWHSDSETSIDIDRKMAIDIIKFLMMAHEIRGTISWKSQSCSQE
jgi:hypothetical protein